MADLQAQGEGRENTWRKVLAHGETFLGRVPTLCELATPWDKKISSKHASLTPERDKLRVKKLSAAKNPIFYNGKEINEFIMSMGEFFLIGDTKFSFLPSESTVEASDLPSPLAEVTCSAKELADASFDDAADRIEALSSLPNLIRFSPSEQELERQALDVLLKGVPRADLAAIVVLDSETGAVKVRAQRGQREGMPLIQPSVRLVVEAVRRRRQPVFHTWLRSQSSEFTPSINCDWAICVPLPDDPTPGWALYVLGASMPSFADVSKGLPNAQKGDLKFTQVAADILGALRQMGALQRRKSMLESFLSPTVLQALAHGDQQDLEDVLRPRQINSTVLFCDLRGFSQMGEVENLEEHCERVSEALSVMTRNILDKDGVISDFQGDSAMGFWGWPLEAPDSVAQAARSALAIRKEFIQYGKRRGHPLQNFTCGIGLAQGTAIAGRLGAFDQAKVGVFGPVVNLAARLEALTKYFRTPILVDETVAQSLRQIGGFHFRMRLLGRFQPAGMKRVVELHELMLPRHEPGAMSEQMERDFEVGVAAFLAGRWSEAENFLGVMRSDGPSLVLLDFMRQHHGRPPTDWNGIITFDSKRPDPPPGESNPS